MLEMIMPKGLEEFGLHSQLLAVKNIYVLYFVYPQEKYVILP